jgi:hypothetical protein
MHEYMCICMNICICIYILLQKNYVYEIFGEGETPWEKRFKHSMSLPFYQVIMHKNMCICICIICNWIYIWLEFFYVYV